MTNYQNNARKNMEDIDDLENIATKQDLIHCPDYMAVSIQFILDKKLSYAARGLGTYLTYISSQHILFDIEDYPKDLINELIENGYLRGEK